MTTFVLVHGASHGSWCWYKIAARLRQRGHQVIVPNLPGHGIDRMDPADATLDGYTDALCAALAAADMPVTLVGHSMGGIVITQAAERMPEKIAKLVYLTAFLLPAGQSAMATLQDDTASRIHTSFTPTADNRALTINPEAQRSLFFHDCSDEDVELARTLLTPQAFAPLLTPISTTAARWGSIPRDYIECLQDQAISIATQRTMHSASPCARVTSLGTSHSPFFSAPDALVEILLSA